VSGRGGQPVPSGLGCRGRVLALCLGSGCKRWRCAARRSARWGTASRGEGGVWGAGRNRNAV